MLDVSNLVKRFGDFTALDGVSLDLKPGLFGLLGPNGAGKSTFMRCLATLLTPDEGTIHLDGTDIVANPAAMRTTLGYLPQDFGVYPRTNALDLLNHIAVLKGLTDKTARDEQVRALLRMVNLGDHAYDAVATYSGGMRQRFGVAQALLGDPKVLIVDEPTAGLDPLERQRFLDILSRAGDDKVIILSTHIVEDVRDLCTDMAIMGEGRIIARGEPETLIDAVKGRVWRARVASDAEAEDMQKHLPVLSTRRQRGATVVSILSDDTPHAGTDLVWERDAETLEDAYFAHLNGLMGGGVRRAA